MITVTGDVELGDSYERALMAGPPYNEPLIECMAQLKEFREKLLLALIDMEGAEEAGYLDGYEAGFDAASDDWK